MVIMSRKLICSFSLIILSILFIQKAEGATIRVELDRSPVLLSESFSLVFEAEGSVDDDPDFSPLENVFEILGQSEGSTMQIINGEISRKQQWTLTLMAKEPGRVIIPPILFGKDKSQSIQIDIKKAEASQSGSDLEPIFIEVSAEPATTYVQSQVIFTVRLYRSVHLVSGNLSEPTLSDADAVIEKLGDDRGFETTRNDQRYLVVERVYAIFPQESGRLTVAPVNFAGQLGSQSGSMFGPFSRGGAIKRVQSKSLDLTVNPVPQDKMHGRWLPARELRIVEKWPETNKDTEPFKAGEPITRTIMIVAEGLTSAQLPEIKSDMPDGIKSYPDQPTLENKKRNDGVIGIRQEKIALIPKRAGSYRLPAIEIPWWNTMTQKMEVARLEARRIEVAPSEEAEDATPSIPLQKEVSGLEDATGSPVSGESQKGASFWSLISMVLGLGWALTLVAWWGSRQKQSNQNVSVEDIPIAPETGPIKRQLKKACMQNEAEAAKEALLLWCRALWPAQPVSLGEVSKRVGGPLASEIRKLNGVLYSKETIGWQNGSALWEAFEQETTREKVKTVREPKGLVPMVP